MLPIHILQDFAKSSHEDICKLTDAVGAALNLKNQTFKINVDEVPNEGYHIAVFGKEGLKEYSVDADLDGNIICMAQICFVPLKNVAVLCQLKPVNFPSDIRVHNLFDTANLRYEPLHTSDSQRDFMLRIPTYDTKTHDAYILNRYSRGMNVGVGLYDRKENTMYTWDIRKYEYPGGIAVRLTANGAEIYLNNDGIRRKILFGDPMFIHGCDSDWYPLPVDKDFAYLSYYMDAMNNINNMNKGAFTHFTRIYDTMADEMERLTRDKKYDDAAAKGHEIVSLVGSDSQYDFGGSPSNIRIKYDTACVEALRGNVKIALELLLELEHLWEEWFEWSYLATDPDLEVLQDSPEFQAMLARH